MPVTTAAGNQVPSSHGSLDGEEADNQAGPSAPGGTSAHPLVRDTVRSSTRKSSMNSSEFDELDVQLRWLPSGRTRPREDDSDEDRGTAPRGHSGPPPEWDGVSLTFQDWLIKCRLWMLRPEPNQERKAP